MTGWLRMLVGVLVIASALVAGAGCVARAHVGVSAVLVASPPPRPVVVTPLACPAGHLYVDGRYHWNGTAWIWVEPACYYKPGYVWVSPTYVVVGSGVRYTAGYWKPAPASHKAYATGNKPHPVVQAKPVKHKGALPDH
jgi:hypothetical protein